MSYFLDRLARHIHAPLRAADKHARAFVVVLSCLGYGLGVDWVWIGGGLEVAWGWLRRREPPAPDVTFLERPSALAARGDFFSSVGALLRPPPAPRRF
jgi:hypothetical protein